MCSASTNTIERVLEHLCSRIFAFKLREIRKNIVLRAYILLSITHFTINIAQDAFTLTKTENMTLCSDKCISGCETYIIETGVCFNPQKKFPNSTVWGTSDVLDVFVDYGTRLNRTFFESTNGTCLGNTDGFLFPLNQCVGPFGPPRPWGIFHKKRS